MIGGGNRCVQFNLMSETNSHLGYICLVNIISFRASLETFIAKPMQLQQANKFQKSGDNSNHSARGDTNIQLQAPKGFPFA